MGCPGAGASGLFALQRENNGRGACDMGAMPEFLPGYRSVENAKARQEFEKHWGTQLPAERGLTLPEMMAQARAGKVKGMVIFGENPVLALPQPEAVRAALGSLEFLLVADLFQTETAKLATVVLPAASFAEKDGTFTNFEGRVQRVRKVVEPVGDSRSDGKIVEGLTGHAGRPTRYASPDEVMDEIKELVPAYRGVNYADLDSRNEAWVEFAGARRDRSGKLQFSGQFGRFAPAAPLAQAPVVVGDEYPFILFLGSTLSHFGTGSRSSRCRRLKQFSPEPFVEIGAEDAEKLGIRTGERVTLTSAAGWVSVGARVTGGSAAGTCFMPISFPGCPAHSLLDAAGDGKGMTLKACAVRLEKGEGHG